MIWSGAVWSMITLAIFFAWRKWFFLKFKKPWLHPVLWATLSVVVILETSGHSYPDYKGETQWMIWWLGPAVVALAVPIYKLRNLVRENLWPLVLIIIVGVLSSIFSVVALLMFFGLAGPLIQALCLKSITAPVALGIAREIGAPVAIAAFGVMVAGIMGAVAGPPVLYWLRIKDARAQGLALGCGSHGVGTARALELGPVQGAFASVGMSCTAIAASMICPLLLVQVIR
jgi:putative effector of murein hydrolase